MLLDNLGLDPANSSLTKQAPIEICLHPTQGQDRAFDIFFHCTVFCFLCIQVLLISNSAGAYRLNDKTVISAVSENRITAALQASCNSISKSYGPCRKYIVSELLNSGTLWSKHTFYSMMSKVFVKKCHFLTSNHFEMFWSSWVLTLFFLWLPEPLENLGLLHGNHLSHPLNLLPWGAPSLQHDCSRSCSIKLCDA